MILLYHLHYNPPPPPPPTSGTSTPYPPPDDGGKEIELRNMNLDEIEFDPDDIPLLTDFTNAEDKATVLNKTLRFIKDKFPKVDFKKLGPIGWGKKKTTENIGEIVHFGPKLGESRGLKKDGSCLLKSFTDRFKNALGPSSEELIITNNQEIREQRQRLKEEDKQLKEQEKLVLQQQKLEDEEKYLSDKIEKTRESYRVLEEEHGSNLVQQTKIQEKKQLEKNLQREL